MTQVGLGLQGDLRDPEGYCRDLVRKRDYEWFLVSHFYPKELQGAFFALRAFYVSYASRPCVCLLFECVWDTRLNCQRYKKQFLTQCLGK